MIFREDVLFNALEEERGKDKVVVLYGMEIDRIFFFSGQKKLRDIAQRRLKKDAAALLTLQRQCVR